MFAWVASVLLALAVVVTGCDSVSCPEGTAEVDGMCTPWRSGENPNLASDASLDGSLVNDASTGVRDASEAGDASDGKPTARDAMADSAADGAVAAGGSGGSGGAGQSGSGGDAAPDGQAGVGGDAATEVQCDDEELLCEGTCVSKSDVRNCGACGNDCTMLPNVGEGVTCRDGACVLGEEGCVPGWADCAGGAEDGCETDLSAPEHCGACDVSCAEDVPLCSGSETTPYMCVNGCTEAAPQKCGSSCVDATSDVMHCGGCDMPCTGPDNAVVSCVDGECSSRCKAGYHDCDGTCADDRSVMSCGTSCAPCPSVANAVSTCNGTTCGFMCMAGYHQCGGACVSNADVASCGNRCEPCPGGANATATCERGQCGLRCNDGYHECDGRCVSNDSVASCGNRCEPCPGGANATATCERGQCGLRCNDGYHDCNGECVSDSSVATCGDRCSPCPSQANASVSCDGQQCRYECTANRCDEMCVTRACREGETCSGSDSCAEGLACADGRCRPRCGNGVIERPEEQCEVGVEGFTQWTCGPASAPAGERCMNRRVYTPCSGSGATCGPDSSCQTVDGVAYQCMPSSGLGLDGQGRAADVCPVLNGFTQSLFSNAFCVIDCAVGPCPEELPVCFTNPFAAASDEEAERLCVPAPP